MSSKRASAVAAPRLLRQYAPVFAALSDETRLSLLATFERGSSLLDLAIDRGLEDEPAGHYKTPACAGKRRPRPGRNGWPRVPVRTRAAAVGRGQGLSRSRLEAMGPSTSPTKEVGGNRRLGVAENSTNRRCPCSFCQPVIRQSSLLGEIRTHLLCRATAPVAAWIHSI